MLENGVFSRAMPLLLVCCAWSLVAHAQVPAGALLTDAHRACDRTRLEAIVYAMTHDEVTEVLTRGTRPERMALLRGLGGASPGPETLTAMARVMSERDEELALSAAQALIRACTLRTEGSPAFEESWQESMTSALAVADDVRVRADLRAAARFLALCVHAPPSTRRR